MPTASSRSASWRSSATDDLFDTILSLRDRDEAERFFRDLCTLAELREMSQRWQVVRLLELGRHYAEIRRETGASTATVTRIAGWLRDGEGGYRLALQRRPTADLRAETEPRAGTVARGPSAESEPPPRPAQRPTAERDRPARRPAAR